VALARLAAADARKLAGNAMKCGHGGVLLCRPTHKCLRSSALARERAQIQARVGEGGHQPTVYRRGSALGDDAQQLDLMVNQVGWRRRGEALHAIAQQSSAAPLQAMRS